MTKRILIVDRSIYCLTFWGTLAPSAKAPKKTFYTSVTLLWHFTCGDIYIYIYIVTTKKFKTMAGSYILVLRPVIQDNLSKLLPEL